MDASTAIKVLLIGFVLLLVYAYAGYSRLLAAAARMRKMPPRDTAYRPMVTIFVPAYNEERVIEAKIRNCLAQDYPPELIEILVCSDASTDRTEAIVREFGESRVRLLAYSERSGKTGLINKSVPGAGGEIVVLTDANTRFAPDAVSKLVSMYSSERIGAVAGQVKLHVPDTGWGVDREVTYREFEAGLKYHEGLFGTTVGAFGGLYSIRKALFKPLPANAYSNDDFLIPMRILADGRHVVFDKEAVSSEETGKDVAEEFRRRVRIGAGNFQSFFLLPKMLNPLRGMAFVCYFSHKVLRWFSPLMLLSIFVLNLMLVGTLVFDVMLGGQVLAYVLAGMGGLFSRRRRRIPVLTSLYHFVSINAAIVGGFFVYLKGIKSAAWTSTERGNG